jgi:hypothetical protein
MSTVVRLRNRTFSRAVGTYGEASLTLLISVSPDASGFWVFGCAALAKVPIAQRENLDLKLFRGVFVGYPPSSLGYKFFKARDQPSIHRR